MVTMVVLPFDGGRPVTKSSTMRDQGLLGIERGCRSPVGGWCVALLLMHTVQAKMNSQVSVSMDGHQK